MRPVSRRRQFLGQLHALRLAARQRGRRLAELDVAQADVDQRLQLARQRRHRLEQLQRVLDGHLQHVVDVVALVEDLQRLAVVALAVADVAGHVDVGQEVHFDLDQAVALAGFAAAAAHVEAEATRRVAARARFRHLCEQFAQRREQSGVGRRIGTRRAADRRLVDVDDLVEQLDACPLRGSGATVCDAPFSSLAAIGYRVSLISVDLPEPETPVMQVNSPAGWPGRRS